MLSKTRNFIGFALAGTLLASCGIPPGRPEGPAPRPAAGVVQDYPVKIGNPYQVNGVTYVPADIPDYDEVGYASWYGEESGVTTANGERFNPTAVSAAHKILPLPSYVEVTALATGRTILVRVNDRGPFARNRIIDLSRGAADQLGIIGKGSAAVRVRRVTPLEPDKAILRAGGRVPERAGPSRTLLAVLKMRLEGGQIAAPPSQAASQSAARETPATPLNAVATAANGYFVQIASFTSEARAVAMAQRIDAQAVQSGGVWRVRYGPYQNETAAHQGLARAAAAGFNDAKIVLND